MGDAGADKETENQDTFLTPEFAKPVFLQEAGEGDDRTTLDAAAPLAAYEHSNPVADKVDFAVGDFVQGNYKNRAWYNAKIAGTAGANFVITWDDGILDDTEKAGNELRVRPSFKSGDLVRARRKDGFFCNARIVAESGCKYVVEWDDGEMATIDDGTDLEFRHGGRVGFKVGDRVRAPRNGQVSLGQGRIVRIEEGPLFVIEWEDNPSDDFGRWPAEKLTRQDPPKSEKIPVAKGPPIQWVPSLSVQTNEVTTMATVETDETPAAAAKRRQKKALKITLLTILALSCIAGWCVWIAIPVQYIRVGRHEVRDTWDAVNCTVLAQSCWKECGGCGCPDSCCESAEDCVRSNYFMSPSFLVSQTCVWLSQSKFEQNRTDYTAKVSIRNDIAAASRSRSSLLAAAALAIGSALLLGGKRRHAAALLAGAIALAGARQAQGGCDCAEIHQVSMTVAYDGVVVTKELGCAKVDGRSFCKSEFQFRDKSCSTLEDLEQKVYCQEPYLNRIGRSRVCYVNPADPSELEISGTKGIPIGTIVAITLWGCATFLITLMGLILIFDRK